MRVQFCWTTFSTLKCAHTNIILLWIALHCTTLHSLIAWHLRCVSRIDVLQTLYAPHTLRYVSLRRITLHYIHYTAHASYTYIRYINLLHISYTYINCVHSFIQYTHIHSRTVGTIFIYIPDHTTIPYRTMPCHAIPCHTIPCHTMPYNPYLHKYETKSYHAMYITVRYITTLHIC